MPILYLVFCILFPPSFKNGAYSWQRKYSVFPETRACQQLSFLGKAVNRSLLLLEDVDFSNRRKNNNTGIATHYPVFSEALH